MAGISRPRPRLRSLVLALAMVFTIFFTFSRLGLGIRQLYISNKSLYLGGVDNEDFAAQVDFWRRFAAVLRAHAPTTVSPSRLSDSNLDIDFVAQERPRPDLLLMPHNYVNVMREAHEGFLSDIKFTNQTEHESLSLPYKPTTIGIVSTARGSNLVVFVIS